MFLSQGGTHGQTVTQGIQVVSGFHETEKMGSRLFPGLLAPGAGQSQGMRATSLQAAHRFWPHRGYGEADVIQLEKVPPTAGHRLAGQQWWPFSPASRVANFSLKGQRVF